MIYILPVDPRRCFDVTFQDTCSKLVFTRIYREPPVSVWSWSEMTQDAEGLQCQQGLMDVLRQLPLEDFGFWLVDAFFAIRPFVHRLV